MKMLRMGLFIIYIVSFTQHAYAETVSRTVPLKSEITRVYLNGASEFNLTQGDEEFVRLTAPEEVLAGVEARIKGKSLHLGKMASPWADTPGEQNQYKVRFDVQLKRFDAIRVRGANMTNIGDIVSNELRIIVFGNSIIETQHLKAQRINLEIGGNGEFKTASIESEKTNLEVVGNVRVEIDQLNTVELEMDLSGNTNVTLNNVNGEELDLDSTGGVDLEVIGSVVRQELEINGSGRYSAAELVSDYIYLEIRGDGRVQAFVNQALTAELARGADLVYSGSPELVVDINGQGRYRNADNNSRN